MVTEAQDVIDVGLRPATEADDELLLHLFVSTRRLEFDHLPLPPRERDDLLRRQLGFQLRHYEDTFPGLDRWIVVDHAAGLRGPNAGAGLRGPNAGAGLRGPNAGTGVGRLDVHADERRVQVVELVIAEEARGAGIGTAVLGHVIAEAADRGLPVALSVETGNVRARRLYRRLGFRTVGDDGSRIALERP